MVTVLLLLFTTIVAGGDSQIEEQRTVVVRTQAAWDALWRDHGAQGKPAAVDFSKEMVVAVFAGTRPSAGYAVEITAIEVREGRIEVAYRERQPRPDEMVAQMLTAPFHIVRTTAREGKAVFTRSAAR